MIKNNNIIKYKNNIPIELQNRNQWLVYKTITEKDKNGIIKTKKIPYSAITLSPKNWNKKENWTSFENAINVLENNSFNGLSFILTEEDPYICIDLDNCINDNIKPLANNILKIFSNTYTELSQSKNGLHIFLKGSIKNNINNGEHKIELYTKNKCIAITGNTESNYFNEIKDIKNYEKEIKELYDTYAPKISIKENISKFKAKQSDYVPDINTILETIKKYNNYAFSLFNGSYSSGDKSKDDFLLLLILNSFTHGNPNLMKEIFLQSALNRINDKSKRNTEKSYLKYLDKSIQKAIYLGKSSYWNYENYKKGGVYIE